MHCLGVGNSRRDVGSRAASNNRRPNRSAFMRNPSSSFAFVLLVADLNISVSTRGNQGWRTGEDSNLQPVDPKFAHNQRVFGTPSSAVTGNWLQAPRCPVTRVVSMDR